MLALFEIMHMQKVLIIGCRKTKRMFINICSDLLDGKKILECASVEIGMEMLSNCMKNKNKNVCFLHLLQFQKELYSELAHSMTSLLISVAGGCSPLGYRLVGLCF